MMDSWRLAVVVSCFVIIHSAAGCGGKSEQTPAGMTMPSRTEPPEWAPENPSEEFLRAAQILRPLPPREWIGPAKAALAAANQLVDAASYEFFGTLTNEQIERLVATEKLKIPVRSLSDKQRAVLNHWFDVWREAYQGVSAVHTSGDRLVDLYKLGAAEDLSNVSVGFNVPGGHCVNMRFWIRLPDGDELSCCGNSFATI